MGRTPENSLVYRGAELSKKIDYIFMAVGAGIYVLWNKTVGGVLMIGSAITWFAADRIQKGKTT